MSFHNCPVSNYLITGCVRFRISTVFIHASVYNLNKRSPDTNTVGLKYPTFEYRGRYWNGRDYCYSFVIEPTIQKQNQYKNTRWSPKKSQPFKNRIIHQLNSFGPFVIQTRLVFEPSLYKNEVA